MHQHLFVAGDCFTEVSQLCLGQAEIVACLREVGTQPQRLPQQDDRLAGPAQLGQLQAEVIQRFGIVGPIMEGPVEARQRLVVLAQVAQRVGQVKVRFRVVRLLYQSSPQTVGGLRKLSLLSQGYA